MGLASKVREVVPQCETCGASMVPMVSSYFCPNEDKHKVPWRREFLGEWKIHPTIDAAFLYSNGSPIACVRPEPHGAVWTARCADGDAGGVARSIAEAKQEAERNLRLC